MSKLDQLKALGDAKRAARNNTPEASGTARKAPSGSLFGEPSRNSVRASLTSKSALVSETRADTTTAPGLTRPPVAVVVNQSRAKATKAKPSGLDAKGPSKTPVTPADRVVSRLGAGRTAQDSPRLETAEAVAILKRGRPRIGEKREKPWLTANPPMSERTWRRRQAEKAK